jgi:hypothetical protein
MAHYQTDEGGAKRIDNVYYVKAGQGECKSLPEINFFLSIEKRKSIILEAQKFFEYTFSPTPQKRGSG